MTTYCQLRQLLSQHTPTERLETITPQSWLQDLGLDSIAMMGLVVDVEDTFHVILDQRSLFGLRTVSDLVSWIDEARS